MRDDVQRVRAHSREPFNDQVSATNRSLLTLRGGQVRVQGLDGRKPRPEQSPETRPPFKYVGDEPTDNKLHNKLVQGDRGKQGGEGEKDTVDTPEGDDERSTRAKQP